MVAVVLVVTCSGIVSVMRACDHTKKRQIARDLLLLLPALAGAVAASAVTTWTCHSCHMDMPQNSEEIERSRLEPWDGTGSGNLRIWCRVWFTH